MDLAGIVTASWWAVIPLIAVGSVLHFVYDWSRHHRVAAVFSAVNESYWEHIKLAIWPVLLWQAVLFGLGGWMLPSFVPAATLSLYSIPVTMIGLVFFYKWISKRNILALDIGVFAVCIVVAQVLFSETLQHLDAGPVAIVVASVFLVGLVGSFLRFTLRPPREPDVFVDPLTGKYGVHGHPGAPTPQEPEARG